MAKRKPQPIRRLLAFSARHLPWLVITVIMSAAGTVLTLLTSRYLGRVTDQALIMDPKGFVHAILPLIVVVLIELPVSFLKSYGAGKYSENCLCDIRNETAGHIAGLPVSYLDSHPSGDLMSRLSNDLQLVSQFLQGSLVQMISDPLTFAAAAIYLFLISPKLSLFSFACIPIFLILTLLISKPMEKLTKEQQEALADVNVVSQDMISGMAEAKSFQLERPMAEKFGSAVDRAVRKALAAVRIQAVIGPVSALMQLVPFILIFAYGGYLVIQGEMSFGSLLAFINLTNYVVNPLTTFPRVISAFRAAAGAGGRILEIWDEPMESQGGMTGLPNEIGADALCFDHVDFSYSEDQTLIQGLRFSVASGATVALVGPSGCGKSTVFKLASGFYRAQSGNIRILGRPLQEWDIRSLREQIAWVSQDTYLFPGSIYENIRFGKESAAPEEVYAAAQAAGIHDFVMSLPEQYETRVGERGVRLSGGQRQRLSIARAVLKDAPILLLDEATSALDTESEHQVQTALNRLMQGRTTLVVAHRLSTIRSAQEILVMDRGTIVEKGTHEALLDSGLLYKRLYNTQMATEEGLASCENGSGELEQAI